MKLRSNEIICCEGISLIKSHQAIPMDIQLLGSQEASHSEPEVPSEADSLQNMSYVSKLHCTNMVGNGASPTREAPCWGTVRWDGRSPLFANQPG